MSSNHRTTLAVLVILPVLGLGIWLAMRPKGSEGPTPNRPVEPSQEVLRPEPSAGAQPGERQAVSDAPKPTELRGRQPGQWAKVQLSYASSTKMLQEGMAADHIVLGFEHAANLLVLGATESHWVMELDLTGIEVRLQTGQGLVDMSEASRQLGQPMLVLLSSEDRIEGYRFPPGFPVEQRNTIRSLCSAIRVPHADGGWQGSEGDAGGMADLRVEVQGEPARKATWTRRGYAQAKGEMRPTLEGNGVAIGEGSGWWSETSYREEQQVTVPELKLEVRQELTATSKRLEQGWRQVQPQANLFEGPWEPAEGTADVPTNPEDPADDEYASLDFDMVLTHIGRLLLSGQDESMEWYRAHQRLVDLLRTDKLLADKVLALLLDPRLDPKLAADLAGAAGAAGTPELQSVLVKVAKADGLDVERRGSALVSLTQIDKPDLASFQQLLSIAHDGTADPRLRSASLFMLGAAAGREGADPALMQQLLSFEEAAVESGMLDRYLEALGNTGSAQILPKVVEHLESNDPKVRSAALDALRRLETPEAVSLLQQYATQDPSPQVRIEAVDTLSGHSGSHVISTYKSMMSDSSASVRSELARALDKRPEPQAKDLLRKMSLQDSDPNVRQLAAELLAND
jgi:HEAT repeat protein